MSNDQPTGFVVTGDTSPFAAAMRALVDHARGAQEGVKGAFNGLTSPLAAVQGQLAAMAALLGGGAMFKASVDTTKELASESVKLSKALGITTEEGSILNVALKGIGSSADVYTGANQKLTKQLKTNEAGLIAMGVQTRNANGELKNGQEIMTSAVEALKGYKEGTDRNLAAQAMFGKGAAEAAALMKLTTKVMEEARVKAEAFGLTVGSQQAGEVKAYKLAMEDVGLVLEGVKNTIGQAMIPVLTQLAQWFAETGPTRIKAMRVAMDGVADVFRIVIDTAVSLKDIIVNTFTQIAGAITEKGEKSITGMQFLKNIMSLLKIAALSLELGFVTVFETIGTTIAGTISMLRTFAEVASAAFKLDWDGVSAAWAEGTARGSKMVEESIDRVVKKSEDIQAAMLAVANGDAISKRPQYAASTSGGGNRQYRGEGEKGEVDPSLMKSYETMLEQRKLAFEKEHAMREFSKADELAYWRELLATQEVNAKDKISIQLKTSRLEVDVLRDTTRKQREIGQLRADDWKAETLDYINELQARTQQERDLGLISQAEYLERQKAFNARRLQAELEFIAEKIEVAKLDPVRNAVLLEQLEIQTLELRRKYAALNAQIGREQVKETAGPMLALADQLGQSFQNVANSLLKSWKNLGSALRTELKGIGSAIINEVVLKPLRAKIIAWAKERALTLAGIGADAAKAGSGAAASQASIPVFGPYLALAAMAAVMLAVGNMSSKVPSAAGGFSIPRGLNPLTQLHEEEMVLPADLSNRIRSMTGTDAGGGITINHFHLNNWQNWDGDNIKKALIDNPAGVAAGINNAVRRGHL